MPGYILPNNVQLNYTVDYLGLVTIHSAIIPETNPNSISIPAQIDGYNVDALSDDCFKGSPFKKIELPDTLRYIGNDAFSKSSIEEITLPKHLVVLGSNCFSFCHNLKNINIKEGLTRIPTSCFQECASLKNINLPKSLEFIAFGSFSGCYGLENVIIPKNIDTIASTAFYSCGLRSVTFLGEDTNLYINAFEKNPNMMVKCIKGSTVDKNFNSWFPENCTKRYAISDIGAFLNDIIKIENTQEK